MKSRRYGVLVSLILSCCWSGTACRSGREAIHVSSLSIPFGIDAQEFFAGSKWNWDSFPAYWRIHERIRSAQATEWLLLEIGNENEGAYAVIGLLETIRDDYVLLTNYDQELRAGQRLRMEKIRESEYEHIVQPLRLCSFDAPTVQDKRFIIDDGTAFFITYSSAKVTHTVEVSQVLVGEDRKSTGIDVTDQLLGTLSDAIAQLFALAESGTS